MTTKKFWCHYIGRDGNTPKRRSIELTNLAELIPTIGDNEHCETPLWYERSEDGHEYQTYAQLSDNVAVSTALMGVLEGGQVELLQKSDSDIDAKYEEKMQSLAAEPFFQQRTEEEKEETRKAWRRNYDDYKLERNRFLAKIKAMQSFTDLLLRGLWVTGCAVRAYKDADSPYSPVIEELRRQGMAMREEEDRKRREQRRKEAEEEAMRKAEEEAKEQERLTQEAVKFKNGESISGDDVVDLCRRYGINVHLRTVHNLQQVVTEINGKKGRCSYHQYGKRSPKLDGCFKTAEQLYNYLQTHEAA